MNWVHGDRPHPPTGIIYRTLVPCDAFGSLDTDEENEDVIRQTAELISADAQVSDDATSN